MTADIRIDNDLAREMFSTLKLACLAAEGPTLVADVLAKTCPEGNALIGYVVALSEAASTADPAQCRHSIMRGVMRLQKSLVETRFAMDEADQEGIGHAITLGMLVGYMTIGRYIGGTLDLFDAFDKAGKSKGGIGHS